MKRSLVPTLFMSSRSSAKTLKALESREHGGHNGKAGEQSGTFAVQSLLICIVTPGICTAEDLHCRTLLPACTGLIAHRPVQPRQADLSDTATLFQLEAGWSIQVKLCALI